MKDNNMIDIFVHSLHRKQKKDFVRYLELLSFGQLLTEANDLIKYINSLSNNIDDNTILQANFLLNEINRRVGSEIKDCHSISNSNL